MSENRKQLLVRRPGSQVAPGQKPLFKADRQTATTHSRIPVHEATAGKLYRVRDKVDANGAAIVWGEKLSHEEACKLKEKVCGTRQSRTARVEEMPPDELDAADTASEPSAAAPIASNGIVDALADVPLDLPEWSDAQLLVWMGVDPMRWAKAFIVKSAAVLESGDDPFDVGFVVGWFANVIDVVKSANQTSADPQLEIARQKALAAARPVAAQAQARAVVAKAVPVPQVKPAAKKPVVVADPPKPPPSPLSDDVIEDGPAELPPDEEVLDGSEISDISAEVGGGPSDADKAKAREQAAKDVEGSTAAARAAYAAAVGLDTVNGPWPSWDQLGQFEHAAWRYYVTQGGDPPELVKQPRKVAHAMGSAS